MKQRTLLWPTMCLLWLTMTTVGISAEEKYMRGIRSDVPYVKCETCAHIAEVATNETNQMDVKQVSEVSMLDMVETLCDPDSKFGKWTKSVDMVERVRKIRLEIQDGTQVCKQECRTLAMACVAVLDGVESELAEKLYSLRKNGDEVDKVKLTSWLCDKNGASTACAERTPLFPKSRPTGPPFEPQQPGMGAMEDMMRQLKQQNGGMDVKMMNGGPGRGNAAADADDDDDDDDDDNDDDNIVEGDESNDNEFNEDNFGENEVTEDDIESVSNEDVETAQEEL